MKSTKYNCDKCGCEIEKTPSANEYFDTKGANFSYSFEQSGFGNECSKIGNTYAEAELLLCKVCMTGVAAAIEKALRIPNTFMKHQRCKD